jgi:neutral ceramidase
MKKLLYVLLALLSVVLVLAAVCFKPLDTTPYKTTAFYKNEMAVIDSLVARNDKHLKSFDSGTDTMQVGWSCVNLHPPFTTPIAIDAHRGGKHFEGVHDSIYVRAFVFKQGMYKVAYISADLLIIPPTVTRILDTILAQQGFSNQNIYYTATHTHTSIGAWYNSVVGEIFAGKYDERVPVFIAQTIAAAVTEAEKQCAPAKIGYAGYPTQKLVFNRLITQMAHLLDSLGEVDSILRVVKIEKETGEKAAIITFSAHNTVFHESLMKLSADWCGLLMSRLNKSGKLDFASFSAGAVGSHGPYEFSNDQETEARYMANSIAKIVEDSFDSIPTAYAFGLSMMHVPLYLRQPNLRIAQNVVLRPWLFKKLFGDEAVYINTLQVGDLFFAGMPCDYSGELVNEMDSVAAAKKLKLIVTSFNGGYMGYVTDCRRYKLNTYETRTMGWFGDNNGDYLTEITNQLVLRTRCRECFGDSLVKK